MRITSAESSMITNDFVWLFVQENDMKTNTDFVTSEEKIVKEGAPLCCQSKIPENSSFIPLLSLLSEITELDYSYRKKTETTNNLYITVFQYLQF